MRSGTFARVLSIALLCVSAPRSHAAGQNIPAPVVPAVQGHYLTGCGGCHGIQGHSGRMAVPDLAGAVGWFLCAPSGRDYLIRLPNVAFANLSDEDLTAMMNFIVFTFGKTTVPKGSLPFTTQEIAAARQHPFQGTSMHIYRDAVVRDVIRACSAASPLHDYDLGQNRNEVHNGTSLPVGEAQHL